MNKNIQELEKNNFILWIPENSETNLDVEFIVGNDNDGTFEPKQAFLMSSHPLFKDLFVLSISETDLVKNEVIHYGYSVCHSEIFGDPWNISFNPDCVYSSGDYVSICMLTGNERTVCDPSGDFEVFERSNKGIRSLPFNNSLSLMDIDYDFYCSQDLDEIGVNGFFLELEAVLANSFVELLRLINILHEKKIRTILALNITKLLNRSLLPYIPTGSPELLHKSVGYSPLDGRKKEQIPFQEFLISRLLVFTKYFDGLLLEDVDEIDNWDFIERITKAVRQQWNQRCEHVLATFHHDAKFIVVADSKNDIIELIRQNRVDAVLHEVIFQLIEDDFFEGVKLLVNPLRLGVQDLTNIINIYQKIPSEAHLIACISSVSIPLFTELPDFECQCRLLEIRKHHPAFMQNDISFIHWDTNEKMVVVIGKGDPNTEDYALIVINFSDFEQSEEEMYEIPHFDFCFKHLKCYDVVNDSIQKPVLPLLSWSGHVYISSKYSKLCSL
eukprot:TRINITY_DN2606_c0_g1_i1.p1 TRINITY_DN2606_c0_g1~~TRINITY_DN2606_c0_g1_i1.p1  ORF type:complete len:499 (+),score=137.52 TRINITY_DN2606_c0_g1_i1:177-1673(+)